MKSISSTVQDELRSKITKIFKQDEKSLFRYGLWLIDYVTLSIPQDAPMTIGALEKMKECYTICLEPQTIYPALDHAVVSAWTLESDEYFQLSEKTRAYTVSLIRCLFALIKQIAIWKHQSSTPEGLNDEMAGSFRRRNLQMEQVEFKKCIELALNAIRYAEEITNPYFHKNNGYDVFLSWLDTYMTEG